MTQTDIDNWMNASDEERADIIAGWNISQGDGRHVAEACAALLVKECVYDVTTVSVISDGDRWQILAHADSDYDSLKDRNIDFLGFHLVIEKAQI